MRHYRSFAITTAFVTVTMSWGFPQYHLTLPPVLDGQATWYAARQSGYTVCFSEDGRRLWRIASNGNTLEVPHADLSIDYPDMSVQGIDRDGSLYGIARTRVANRYVPYRWTPETGYQYNYENPINQASDFYIGAINDNGLMAGGTQQEGYPSSSVMWDQSGAIIQDMSDILVGGMNTRGDAVGFGPGYRAVLRRFGARSSMVLPWSPYDPLYAEYGASNISSRDEIIGEGHRSGYGSDILFWNLDGQLTRSIHVNSNFGISQVTNNRSSTFVVDMVPLVTDGFYEDRLYLGDQGGNITLLSTLLDVESAAHHFHFWSPSDYQDDGSMRVVYYDAARNYHTALLTPVPEPGSLAVLGLGAVGLLKRRKT